MRVRSVSSLFALLLIAGLTSALGTPPNDGPTAGLRGASSTICVEYLTGSVICGPSAGATALTPEPPPCENGTAVRNPQDNPDLVADCAILLDVKATLAGDATLNWDARTPIADWDGITIHETYGRVREVSLESRGLTGSIPAELAGLSLLRGLRLTDNHLTGPIPWQLWALSSLSELRLAGNTGLTGCIPSLLQWLPSHDLDALGLPDCSRTQLCENGIAVANPQDNPGLVADCVSLLTVNAKVSAKYAVRWDPRVSVAEWEGITIGGTPPRVRGLRLWGRGLDGRLSPELGDLSELRILRLGINQLRGPIPAELGNLRHLQTLHLDGNELTGTIPVELGSLSNLTSLHLTYNQLTGPIPVALGALPALQTLRLDGNQLSGPIPAVLGNLRNLETLSLSDNQLRGAIPPALGALAALESLSLAGNHLSSAIPATLGTLRGLRVLHLNHNDLSGAIPAELGDLSALRILLLHNNGLSGPIPTALGNLRSLESLWLHTNRLNGAIPAALGKLYNLESLWLYENQLAGAIPAELGSLSTLAFLYMHDNQLSGAIPSELGGLRNLGFLRLHDNELSGAIPTALGRLPHLRHVYLGGNAGLTGCIPAGLRDLPDNDFAVLGLPDCTPEMLPPPAKPPQPEPIVLPYNRLDTTGSATTPGSYAFLDGAANMISTYEGLREDAVELRIHQADADGASRADAYGTVAPGDIVEWRQASACWVRYEVTAVLPDPPGTTPRKHFAIKWLAHAGTGCVGAIAGDSAARVTLHPASFFSPTLSTPVRFGPYQFIPSGWIGAVEEHTMVAPPAPDWPDGPAWSDDPAVVRKHPVWNEPRLPEGWQLSSMWTDSTEGSGGVVADYYDGEGRRAASIWIARLNWRPFNITIWTSRMSEEVRAVDGHPAFLEYDTYRASVWISNETTGIHYQVYYSAREGDLTGRDIEDAIEVARSLYD